MQSSRSLIVQPEQRRADFLKLCDAVTVKPPVTRYTIPKQRKGADRYGSYEFDIPFSRQQLADYLGVERSGLSMELGKMRDEGLLDFHKSHFLLKAPETDGLPPSAR